MGKEYNFFFNGSIFQIGKVLPYITLICTIATPGPLVLFLLDMPALLIISCLLQYLSPCVYHPMYRPWENFALYSTVLRG